MQKSIGQNFTSAGIFLPNDEIEIKDLYLEYVIRCAALTAHHPGGSSAFGKSANSALDNQMRVRGVRRLRVIDASAIPSNLYYVCHF